MCGVWVTACLREELGDECPAPEAPHSSVTGRGCPGMPGDLPPNWLLPSSWWTEFTLGAIGCGAQSPHRVLWEAPQGFSIRSLPLRLFKHLKHLLCSADLLSCRGRPWLPPASLPCSRPTPIRWAQLPTHRSERPAVSMGPRALFACV